MTIFYIVSPDAPEIVFSKGFSSIKSIDANMIMGERWNILDAIKFNLNKSGDQKQAFYVNKCFEAAPIYPLAKKSEELPYTYDDSAPAQQYIYALESQDTLGFLFFNKQVENVLFQIQNSYAMKNLAYALNDSYYDGDIVANIEPDKIIAAVEIIRSNQKPATADLSVYTADGPVKLLGFKTSNERHFKVKSTIYINEDNKSQHKQDCIDQLSKSLNKEYNTPTLMAKIERALINKSDKHHFHHTTYLNYNLQNGYYFEAFMSIARSIYYRIKNAFSNLYNKILPAKIEEPSECLIIPGNSKEKSLTSENNNDLGADLSKNQVITTLFSNAHLRSNFISSQEQQSSLSEEKEDLPHFRTAKRAITNQ